MVGLAPSNGIHYFGSVQLHGTCVFLQFWQTRYGYLVALVLHW